MSTESTPYTVDRILDCEYTSDELAQALEIPTVDHLRFVEMFKAYCEDRDLTIGNETILIRTIRQFLKESKKDVREVFGDALLGQSGCFPYSVRCCLLAGAWDMKMYLARSNHLSNALHILVVREDGRPFDLTHPTPRSATRLTLDSITGYARYIQPIVFRVGQRIRSFSNR